LQKGCEPRRLIPSFGRPGFRRGGHGKVGFTGPSGGCWRFLEVCRAFRHSLRPRDAERKPRRHYASPAVCSRDGTGCRVRGHGASGLPSDRVTFRGFLPHRAGERRRLIASIEGEDATQVFYESPRRAVAALRDLAEILGPRRAAVARELTKAFESWYRGTLPAV